MTRRRRFRVWDRVENLYADPMNQQFNFIQSANDSSNWELEEYIGHVDKNDVEMCEGDILRYCYHVNRDGETPPSLLWYHRIP